MKEFKTETYITLNFEMRFSFKDIQKINKWYEEIANPDYHSSNIEFKERLKRFIDFNLNTLGNFNKLNREFITFIQKIIKEIEDQCFDEGWMTNQLIPLLKKGFNFKRF